MRAGKVSFLYLGVWIFVGQVSGQDILWDNKDTAGECSMSHLTDPVYRATIDDFDVEGDGWIVTGFTALHQWNRLPPGSGFDYELALRENVLEPMEGEPEGPGEVIMGLATSNYLETATGRTFWDREEFRASVDVDATFISAGRYWLETHIVGPENCFIMCAASPHRLNGGWVNYEDLGGILPTRIMFGAYRSGSITISGFMVGEPTDSEFDSVTPRLYSGDPQGGLEELSESDDQYFIITAGPGVRIRRPQSAIVELVAELPAVAVREIGLRLESSTNRTAVTQELLMYDFDAGRWDAVDERPLLRGEDMQVILNDLAESTRFVDQGVVRVRLEAYAPGISVIDHDVLIDQATVLVTVDAL